VRWRGHSLAALLIAAAAWPAAADADTFVPTRLDDPAPDGCEASDCSLREALIAANAHPGADTVQLGEGTYGLSIPPAAPGSDASSGDLNGLDVTIVGAGAGKTVIDGGGGDRVLCICSDGPGSDGTASLVQGVTIQGGRGEEGGGVALLHSSLALVDDAVRGNTVSGDDADGAGIYAVGSLLLERTTVEDNHADGKGGGLYLDPLPGESPKTVVDASTFARNSAVYSGGAGNNGGLGGGAPEMTVVNSTFEGNVVGGSGGGVDTFSGATTHLQGVTVVRNAADVDSAKAAGESNGGLGGGVQSSGGGVTTAANSVIAANSVGKTGLDPDCSGSFVSLGGNLVTDATGCDGFTQPNDRTGVLLTPGKLADNGGSTETVALPPASLAHAIGFACTPTDQRGVPRPARCDAGAYQRVTCGLRPVNLVGTAGPDTLLGSSRSDVILAMAGDDRLIGHGGADTICGGGGRDTLFGGPGRDRLFGDSGRDTIHGGPGYDACSGGRGRDRVRGCQIRSGISSSTPFG
jgi:RTX calcium-binding nonapeptide repeat (4 copies)